MKSRDSVFAATHPTGSVGMHIAHVSKSISYRFWFVCNCLLKVVLQCEVPPSKWHMSCCDFSWYKSQEGWFLLWKLCCLQKNLLMDDNVIQWCHIRKIKDGWTYILMEAMWVSNGLDQKVNEKFQKLTDWISELIYISHHYTAQEIEKYL